ncbi:MAG: glycosyltransferase family 4 protein [Terrimicrobiaceae bacterium]|nr:glycosyltransferase family 4 protein [Terrimicrobiaceae bacterium]
MAMYLHAARLQAVSNVIKDAVVEQTPRANDIARMIPNSLPHDFEIPAQVPPKSSERLEIVYVGRIHEEKGIEILIDAYRQFTGLTQRPARLRIVGPHARNCGGGGEEYQRSLLQKSSALGLTIEWCDPVFESRQLQQYYAEAHVLVYPSIAAKGEASPLTPVEAMASGCIPVVSDLKCFADYLQDGVNGFTFGLAPDPVANLANVLLKISESGISLRRIQENCLRTAERYSLQSVANQYEQDFLNLLAAPTRSPAGVRSQSRLITQSCASE